MTLCNFCYTVFSLKPNKKLYKNIIAEIPVIVNEEVRKEDGDAVKQNDIPIYSDTMPPFGSMTTNLCHHGRNVWG